MAPNHDGFRRNRFRGREQGDFDTKFAKLLRLHGSEPRIFQRRTGSAVNDGISERVFRFNDANTTLEAFAQVKRYENAAALRENSFAGVYIRKLAVGDSFDNSLPGQLQSGTLVRFREGQHPQTSCGLRAYGAGGAF